jgi:hypothetical protein
MMGMPQRITILTHFVQLIRITINIIHPTVNALQPIYLTQYLMQQMEIHLDCGE